MNEVRTLLEQFWIARETDKETYFRVKREVPRFRKFIQEQLGWRLIQNEKLLKLEKIPAHAESFMGITEFQELRDYCILCVVLIFLEDKEEQEQFLLSELPELFAEYWHITADAVIRVNNDKGLEPGSKHTGKAHMQHRIPYTGYNGDYGVEISECEKELTVE